jgi:hypothetical protein
MQIEERQQTKQILHIVIMNTQLFDLMECIKMKAFMEIFDEIFRGNYIQAEIHMRYFIFQKFHSSTHIKT